MKMQLRENIEFRTLAVNCNTFQSEVSKVIEQLGIKPAFVFCMNFRRKVFANTIQKVTPLTMEFAW